MCTADREPVASEERVRVLVADDHEVFAQLLETALGFEGMEVACVAEPTVAGIVADAEAHRPDVAVLDLHLGDGETSLLAISSLVELGVRVIVLTGSGEPAERGACLEAGAAAVIEKSRPLRETVKAIRDVRAGFNPTRPAERDAAVDLFRAVRAETEARLRPLDGLTAQEQAVLAALMRGSSAEHIAEEMVLSVATVRGHIRGILSKLGVRSQTAAVALAYRAGWAPRA